MSGLINLPADVAQLRVEMNERFDAVDQRLQAVDRRFDAIDRRFDANDGRFDAHDGRFDAHDARFDAHDRRFDAHDRRFDALEGRIDGLELELHQFQDVVVTHFIRLEQRMDQGFEESRRMTRVLYEDLVSRIAAIGEGRP